MASRAAEMFETGIDVVILGLTAVHDGGTVEALAEGLSGVT